MTSMTLTTRPRSLRRRTLVAGLGAGCVGIVALRPARASTDELLAAIKAFTGGVEPGTGRIKLDIEHLVENGHAVPITLSVSSPMTQADHVQRIAVFNELNPQSDVILLTLTPEMGRAEVSTRIRLATSQKLVALAKMSDGSCWKHEVDVIVTLAACIE